MNKKFTSLLALILLVVTGLLLICLCVPEGHIFGSATDWFCQHVTLAEEIRQQFYTSGNLLPDYSHLGGGSNFFALSYYGLLRPDVLLSFLFPNVSMAILLQFYAIGEILAGACLFYLWLCRQGRAALFSFMASILYLCANCLFQAHRQIMFVNYLPFLILALWAIDCLTENSETASPSWLPHAGLTLSLVLILLHSFYFFPSCFVVCTLYFYFRLRRHTKQIWTKYLISVGTAVMLASVLLLPTGLAILENKKDVKGTSLLQLLTVNPSLNSLLYSPYGCGLTLICLYTLLLSICRKKTRVLGILIFSFLCFPLCYWLLNGTLYARPKSLIPFVPLLLWLAAWTLEDLSTRRLRHRPSFALICLLPALIQVVFLPSAQNTLILLDMGGLLLFSSLGWIRAKKARPLFKKAGILFSSLCLLVLPVLLFLSKSKTEEFLTPDQISTSSFSPKEVSDVYKNTNYRMDCLNAPLTNTNTMLIPNQKRSTMYSSVSNSVYNQLYYDILEMPVNIRNRVAMTGDVNPFQEYLMGVRYLQVPEEKLPAGYKIKKEKQGTVLGENDQVLPLAYGTSALLDEKEFDALSYPWNLDTLMNRTVVPSSCQQHSTPYRSKIRAYPLPENFLPSKTEKQAYSVTKPLPHPVQNEVLLLSFDIVYQGKSDVSVTINKTRNCLSGTSAPYPNKNTTFTYFLSSPEPLTKLQIQYSKGCYEIRHVSAYTLPLSALSHPDIQTFFPGQTEKNQLLNGSIFMEQDGFFVTSLAFSRGYQALVDGTPVTPLQVNKAFVGFPIKKGSHEIILTFHAPGKRVGGLASLLALGYLFVSHGIWYVSLKPHPLWDLNNSLS